MERIFLRFNSAGKTGAYQPKSDTYKLRGQYSSDYGLLAAGVVILAVPALIIYALFQEQVVKGLTAGAVKE